MAGRANRNCCQVSCLTIPSRKASPSSPNATCSSRSSSLYCCSLYICYASSALTLPKGKGATRNLPMPLRRASFISTTSIRSILRCSRLLSQWQRPSMPRCRCLHRSCGSSSTIIPRSTHSPCPVCYRCSWCRYGPCSSLPLPSSTMFARCCLLARRCSILADWRLSAR